MSSSLILVSSCVLTMLCCMSVPGGDRSSPYCLTFILLSPTLLPQLSLTPSPAFLLPSHAFLLQYVYRISGGDRWICILLSLCGTIVKRNIDMFGDRLTVYGTRPHTTVRRWRGVVIWVCLSIPGGDRWLCILLSLCGTFVERNIVMSGDRLTLYGAWPHTTVRRWRGVDTYMGLSVSEDASPTARKVLWLYSVWQYMTVTTRINMSI